MRSLKEEITSYFTLHDIPFKDNLSSNKRLDFSIKLKNKWTFHFDALEKKEAYDIKHWKLTKEEETFKFIFDDLAARKILAYAPYAGLIVHNIPANNYCFFTVLDLYLMPKIRVNQPVFDHKKLLKGKWIIDFRNGLKCQSFDEAVKLLEKYIDKREDLFANSMACYRNYVGEVIDE